MKSTDKSNINLLSFVNKDFLLTNLLFTHSHFLKKSITDRKIYTQLNLSFIQIYQQVPKVNE